MDRLKTFIHQMLGESELPRWEEGGVQARLELTGKMNRDAKRIMVIPLRPFS
ncbi:hypothetical protein [Burkholderia sp. Bp8992]|uniref:hypothetical protein n=1 Tax=Burkholderia sp. Bp8992 TaxID=2184554 RepID=UPI0016263E79|nr:hypothetical protein [Burkholderia sp. Bp8992]